jgi:hypothetical protein
VLLYTFAFSAGSGNRGSGSDGITAAAAGITSGNVSGRRAAAAAGTTGDDRAVRGCSAAAAAAEGKGYSLHSSGGYTSYGGEAFVARGFSF